ncbi:MAG: hypothetical protein JO192_01000 [Candidatus Eremiobacteraeota bacterium]|nr:hypothetical protein [Candidatus Eremiobacteraeota bacterium]MBV8331294.1 hypothetical protein [Candidatus Eremiobacteraeota bacterium]MBV8723240.1 hypothetical protein [Candidatus Eremiobacteraeota bacterium]
MKRTTIVYTRAAGEDFERAVLEAHGHGSLAVVDLDELATVEMEDIRRLIKLLRKTRDAGTEFALSATRPDVRKALAVTALDAVFTIFGANAA